MSETFIDRLLREARKHRGVKRLFISTREIRTDPQGVDVDHWPAAWHIAKEAGVSWGCGNPGQHQIHVSTEEIQEALPEVYRQACDSSQAADRRYKVAEEEFGAAKEAAIDAWLQTDGAQHLAGALGSAFEVLEACWKVEHDARPEWHKDGQWFAVKEASP